MSEMTRAQRDERAHPSSDLLGQTESDSSLLSLGGSSNLWLHYGQTKTSGKSLSLSKPQAFRNKIPLEELSLIGAGTEGI